MRKVSFNITKLGLVIGNTINVKLIDSVGKPTMSTFGYVCDQNITLSSTTQEIELLENEYMAHQTRYKITLPNSLNFTFVVPVSNDTTAPHDLLSLLNIGCIYGIIDVRERRLADDFVEKLELYFTGENPHFSESQKAVVQLYEYFADDVFGTPATIDIMQMMDEYLATLTGDTTNA